MARAALILAALALVVSLVGALERGPAAQSTAAPTPVDPEAVALRGRVAALEARVDALSRAPITAAPVPPAPTATARAPIPDGATRGADRPVFVEARAPHPALTVTAGPGGALAVLNADPGLAGQVMTVELVTATGEIIERRITVPAAQ